MTIKRQLFISNIIMFVATLLATGLIGRLIIFAISGDFFFDGPPERTGFAQRSENSKIELAMSFLVLIFFAVMVSIVSNIISYSITKKITKHLDPLFEGVKQIHNNNLSYRIGYRINNEFRQVCDAFDEMTGKLHEYALQRQKDDENRRELLAGISHDLRTPLTSIRGYIEGLESGVASSPEIRANYWDTVKIKIADLEHIIDQLFLFSKLDMNNLPLEFRQIDIMEAVSDIVEESAAEYAMRGLTIRMEEMPTDASVSADPIWLRNVIINIMENSVKYKNREQGEFVIQAGLTSNSVVLRFIDDGPGVSPEAIPQLFDVFYRADPSRNKKGSGLGLAISAKVIERMGGSIHAELPVQGGLAIVIILPLLQKEAVL
jgi:signal transduction histidine kinase